METITAANHLKKPYLAKLPTNFIGLGVNPSDCTKNN